MADKHIVISYGRMNPPTLGHVKLVNKVKETAQAAGADHEVILSHSHDSKKNPLSPEQKLKHAKRFFPKTNISVASKEHPSIIHHAKRLNEKGYKHLTVVAGSDRVPEFQHLLHKYNGKDYNFKKIHVVSSGERDPEAEGVEGMSASKMREHAKNGDYKSFTNGIPAHVSDEHSKELFHDVKKGIKEEVEMGSESDEAMAKKSLGEEEQAIKDYTQRIAKATCPQLKKALRHALEEEKTHAKLFRDWLSKHEKKEKKESYMSENPAIQKAIKYINEARKAKHHVGSAGGDDAGEHISDQIDKHIKHWFRSDRDPDKHYKLKFNNGDYKDVHIGDIHAARRILDKHGHGAEKHLHNWNLSRSHDAFMRHLDKHEPAE